MPTLTLYHTIPTFNDPKEEGFGKHCGERRKCWYPAFSSFPTVFSTPSQREIVFFKKCLICHLQTLSIWSCPKICWYPAFSSFPTVFSTLSQREIVFFKKCLICHLQTLSIWSCPKICRLVQG